MKEKPRHMRTAKQFGNLIGTNGKRWKKRTRQLEKALHDGGPAAANTPKAEEKS